MLEPAQKRSGVAARPHEMRHSFVRHMRAAGIDPADLAEITGHTVQTATKHYTHALRRSHAAMRKAIGEHLLVASGSHPARIPAL